MKSDRLKSFDTRIFATLLVSQFCGTSLWFAGNAVLPQLQLRFQWPPEALGYLTSSVQLGFIIGTLTIAWSGLSDRNSPSKVFFVSSVFGAGANLLALIDLSSFPWVLCGRLLTGFFLAGIYPIGMKIAADWREQGLGHWLGALVGALVLGTAFPQSLNLFPGLIKAEALTLIVSMLAVLGGILVLFLIQDGPFRKGALKFSFADVSNVFKQESFRSPAFGYFGHMWELYAFWAFVPWAVSTFNRLNGVTFEVPFWSMIIIASGFLGCLIGGQFSKSLGSKRVAAMALVCSGLCCLISPLVFHFPATLFFALMIFWGVMVVADSPQFSALVAQNAKPEVRGSAITITTCIGFAITIFSIQLLNFLQQKVPPHFLFFFLLPGPILGLITLLRYRPIE
ncbi:MAG TPA: MFS transporter [Cyclobacteriaceae bacterium]|nr:MFS transporter [Cyclobacteriaceae bacterium]